MLLRQAKKEYIKKGKPETGDSAETKKFGDIKIDLIIMFPGSGGSAL